MIAKDTARLAVAVLVGLAAGSYFLVEGLGRSDDRSTVYLALGCVLLACVVLLTVGFLLLQWRQRGLSAGERVAARADRLERARRDRPAWLDSRGYALFMGAVAAYWGYLLVRALGRGDYGIAALDAVLVVAATSASVRVVRRRRRNAD